MEGAIEDSCSNSKRTGKFSTALPHLIPKAFGFSILLLLLATKTNQPTYTQALSHFNVKIPFLFDGNNNSHNNVSIVILYVLHLPH